MVWSRKPCKPSTKLRRKQCMFNWWKNLLNSIRKRGEKTGDSIDEKPPKLDKKTRRKTDHLVLCQGWKPPKSNKENGRGKPDIDWLIEDRDKDFWTLWINGLSTTSTSRDIKGIALIFLMFLILEFLPFLLAPLLRRPRFCFGSFGIVGLAIDGAKSKDVEVTVGFSGCSLWKVLINFWRCMTDNKVS